jgi:hypothetical protein
MRFYPTLLLKQVDANEWNTNVQKVPAMLRMLNDHFLLYLNRLHNCHLLLSHNRSVDEYLLLNYLLNNHRLRNYRLVDSLLR